MVLKWENKSIYGRGVFTWVHFRVEEGRGSQVKVLAQAPQVAGDGAELWTGWSWISCMAASPPWRPLSHPFCRNPAPAEPNLTVTAIFPPAWVPTTHLPAPLGLTFFPPQPGPTFQLCVMHLDCCPCPASDPAKLVTHYHSIFSSYLPVSANRKVPERGQLIQLQINILQLGGCLATLWSITPFTAKVLWNQPPFSLPRPQLSESTFCLLLFSPPLRGAQPYSRPVLKQGPSSQTLLPV